MQGREGGREEGGGREGGREEGGREGGGREGGREEGRGREGGEGGREGERDVREDRRKESRTSHTHPHPRTPHTHTPTHTHLSTLENYAKWQLIQGFLPYLGENFTTPMYKFTQVTQGSGQKERYKTCISTVQSVLPIALARPYTEFVLMNGTKVSGASFCVLPPVPD